MTRKPPEWFRQTKNLEDYAHAMALRLHADVMSRMIIGEPPSMAFDVALRDMLDRLVEDGMPEDLINPCMEFHEKAKPRLIETAIDGLPKRRQREARQRAKDGEASTVLH